MSILSDLRLSIVLTQVSNWLLSFLSKKETQAKLASTVIPFISTYTLAKRLRNGNTLANSLSLGWTSLTPEQQTAVIDVSMISFERAYDFVSMQSMNVIAWIEYIRQQPLAAVHFMPDYKLAEWYSRNKQNLAAGVDDLIRESVELELNVSEYVQ